MPKVLLAFACLITGTLILLSASCGGLGIFAFFDTSPYRGWNILAGTISLVFAVATGVTGRLLFRRTRRDSLATPAFRFAWMAAAAPLVGAAVAVLILDLHTASLPDVTRTILAGDRVVCSAWRTGVLPERGQAVPFEYYGRTYFWRLIALPQDRLSIRYGAVYVNDTTVEGARPYSRESTFTLDGQTLPNRRGFIEVPGATTVALDSDGRPLILRTSAFRTRPVMILFSVDPLSGRIRSDRWFKRL